MSGAGSMSSKKMGLIKVVRWGTFHRNSYDRLEEWWSGILSLGWRIRGTLISSFFGGGSGGVGMVKLVRLQHLCQCRVFSR